MLEGEWEDVQYHATATCILQQNEKESMWSSFIVHLKCISSGCSRLHHVYAHIYQHDAINHTQHHIVHAWCSHVPSIPTASMWFTSIYGVAWGTANMNTNKIQKRQQLVQKMDIPVGCSMQLKIQQVITWHTSHLTHQSPNTPVTWHNVTSSVQQLVQHREKLPVATRDAVQWRPQGAHWVKL